MPGISGVYSVFDIVLSDDGWLGVLVMARGSTPWPEELPNEPLLLLMTLFRLLSSDTGT